MIIEIGLIIGIVCIIIGIDILEYRSAKREDIKINKVIKRINHDAND